jgi:hypothetical protein
MKAIPRRTAPAAGRAAPASSAQAYADRREALELLQLLQRIQAVRSAVGDVRHITRITSARELRKLRLAQRLDALYSDACVPGADRAALWRRLEPYTEIAAQIAKQRKAATGTHGQVRARKEARKKAPLRFDQVPPHPLEAQALKKLRNHKRLGKDARRAERDTAEDLGIHVSELQKKILAPARRVRPMRIPTFPNI